MSLTYILYRDVAPMAEGDATPFSIDATAFSDVSLLPHGTRPGKIATLEEGQWALTGDYKFLDGKTVAFWSEELSDDARRFAQSPVIEIAFDQQHTAPGVTFEFDPDGGNYIAKLNIKWYRAQELLADMDFQPDSTEYFCQQAVEAFDRLVITLYETNLSYRRAKINRITFGRNRRFGMETLRSSSVIRQINLLSAEIPVSTLDVGIDDHGDLGFMFQRKQPVEVWNDSTRLGVFYITEHTRTAASLYTLNCHDAWGVLDEAPFGGGYYKDASAVDILRSIVEPDFELDVSEVDDIFLSGIISPCTRREAAQQVLFAAGWVSATDSGNGIRVFALDTALKDIGKNRVYSGASSSVSALTTEVQVLAHTYTESAQGGVEINGVKYQDTTTLFKVTNPAVSANDKSSVVEVTGATLVSPDIGQEVAQRVYDYYLLRQRDTAKVVWDGERVGDYVQIPTAWQESHTGHIEKMTIKLSNTVAASLEIVGPA